MQERKTLGRREFTVASALAALSGVAITVSDEFRAGQHANIIDVLLEEIAPAAPRSSPGCRPGASCSTSATAATKSTSRRCPPTTS